MGAPARTRTRARSLLRGRGSSAPAGGAVHGVARLGRRTKELTNRLRPGDIAIIDHADLDRMAAEDLVASGVEAVVNVAPSTTGRYPNQGPLGLVNQGVPLVDMPGAPLFEELRDGDSIVLDGGELRLNGGALATGHPLTAAELAEELERQRERVGEALEAFADNTVAHIREEGQL